MTLGVLAPYRGLGIGKKETEYLSLVIESLIDHFFNDLGVDTCLSTTNAY